VRKCLVNQGVVRGHVLDILGCEKGQVNEETGYVLGAKKGPPSAGNAMRVCRS
jgi:hypothetical protein